VKQFDVILKGEVSFKLFADFFAEITYHGGGSYVFFVGDGDIKNAIASIRKEIVERVSYSV
jgi:hypothetical protein